MDQTITLELTLDEVQRLIAALHELIDTEQEGDDNAIKEQDKALLMKLVEVIR
jgi:hypothetical protein